MWANNLRIIAVVLGTLALYTLIANKIPQVQSEVPHALTLGSNVTPEQLVSAGDQLYLSAGGCTACHGLGTRAPNLLTDEKGLGPIGARCGKREPGKDCKAYVYESLMSPRRTFHRRMRRRRPQRVAQVLVSPAAAPTP